MYTREITRDDQGKRWVSTLNEDGSVYSVHEHWTLAERIERLRSAGLRLAYARIGEWQRNHRIPHTQDDAYTWQPYERCPSYVGHSDVSDTPGGYDGTFVRAFVDLGGIGRDEDQAGQTSAVDYSNYRSLWHDFPEDTFTDVSYSDVNSLGAYVGNLSEDVIDILCGLITDYPLYDEEDHSALEHDVSWASWDDWLGRDVRRTIEDSSESDEAMEDTLEALGEDTLREWFYASYSDGSDYPYLETATSAVFPRWEDHARELVDRVWAWRCEPFTAPVPGQEQLVQ